MTTYLCTPAWRIPPADLPIVGAVYPYDTLDYKDVGKETRDFLAKNFSQAPADTQVVAISNHNGLGRQWGIVLMQYPQEPDWRLVGQFGHGLRIPFTNWYIDWSYFWKLRLRGTQAQIWRDRYHNHTLKHPKRLGNLVQAKS